MNTAHSDTPRAGDVVVYKRAGPAAAYAVSVFQHASELVFRTHDDAIRDANAFATKEDVDAWLTEDGELYERMARHRLQRRRQQRDAAAASAVNTAA